MFQTFNQSHNLIQSTINIQLKYDNTNSNSTLITFYYELYIAFNSLNSISLTFL